MPGVRVGDGVNVAVMVGSAVGITCTVAGSQALRNNPVSNRSRPDVRSRRHHTAEKQVMVIALYVLDVSGACCPNSAVTSMVRPLRTPLLKVCPG